MECLAQEQEESQGQLSKVQDLVCRAPPSSLLKHFACSSSYSEALNGEGVGGNWKYGILHCWLHPQLSYLPYLSLDAQQAWVKGDCITLHF